MKKFYLALAIAGLTLTFQTFPAFASCAPPVGISENTARADIVVTGTVSSISTNFASFDVESYYKGQGPDSLKVTGRMSPTSISSVDFEFVEGARYLLFLKGKTKDILRTNDCDGSKLLSSGLTNDEQSALGTGATPSAKATSKGRPVELTYYALAGGTLLGLLLYLLRVRKII